MDPELKDMYQDIIEKQNKLIKELKETTFGGNVEKAETQRTHEIQKPSEEEETLKSSAEKSEKLKQDPGILDMIKHLRKCLAIVRAVTQDKSTQKLTVILENIERIAGHSHGKEIPLKFISDIKVLRDIIGRNMEGTLGGFVSFDNGASQELGFITAAHILFDQHQTSDIEIVQPSYGVQNENNVCGVHIRSVFPTQQDKYGVSVDASLIKLTKRFPDRGTFSGYTVVDLLELGFSKEKPPEYDTDEIRDYRGNKIWTERRNRCCKSGQSSQFTQGCLKLNGFSGKYLESIELLSNPSASSGFYYYSQLEINHIKGLKDFAQPGDSGALVFQIDSQECDKDDKLVCIGMVVGGTSIDTTVVTPIASVLEELNVKLLPLKSEAMEI
ncbi:uncharacterized protein LOC134248945 [Saccostrea cucullata]|uniref:uncharacterized protein LOC134248945 n=1 Tax=Saccostrea cuccullata TaxID=36930 RepID=UPI002ED48798